MKKITLILTGLLFATGMFAQNLQMHYDFGKTNDNGIDMERNFITTTLEMFKPDDFGSTFFFVDMDYDMDNGGVQLLYWEISRGLKFWDFPMEVHVEFTSGNGVPMPGVGFFINRSWMTGVNFPMQIGNVSLSGAALYRQFINAESPDFQFTGTWFTMLLDSKITISGFVDIWTEDNFVLDNFGKPEGKTLKFLAEPQFWYNINQKFSLGTEIEFSRHFVTFDGDIDIMPTAAVKWTF